jgi:hypothetical protein
MKPVGLTMKMSRNKYRLNQPGELMLIHQCIECGSLSINRIAADDDSNTMLAVFEASIEDPIQALCEEYGIRALRVSDKEVLYRQLYGSVAMATAAC